MKPVIVTTSWDDGHKLDLKLAALLKKHGVRGTFYISPQDREFAREDMLSDAQIRQLAKDFEIGAHTMTHPHLDRLSLPDARREIIDSREYLQDITGRRIDTFCYPYGDHTEQVKRAVEDTGFAYARGVAGFALHSGDSFAATTSVQVYDLSRYHVFRLLMLSWYKPWRILTLWRWDVLAKHMVRRARAQGGVFHLWGHSHELESMRQWKRLDAFCAWLAKQPDVIFVVNSEVPIVDSRQRVPAPAIAVGWAAIAGSVIGSLGWLAAQIVQRFEVAL